VEEPSYLLAIFFLQVNKMSGFSKLVFALLLVLLLTMLARYLWNTILVTHITILRPVQTLPETLLLALAISMFTPKR
jgi:hypothetical protein